MKFLVCPQCGIDRFFVLNRDGKRLNVRVNRTYEIVPLDPDADVSDYLLDTIYCLGCSWSGSPRRLVKYLA